MANEVEIKRFMAEQLQQGLSLSEIQQLVNDKFKVKMTYMDIRILASELDTIDWKALDPRAQAEAAKKAKEELISVIDGAAVKLIGAVPYDAELVKAGDEGKLTDELYSTNLTRAFDNIARRTEGEQVPLFNKIRRLKRLK